MPIPIAAILGGMFGSIGLQTLLGNPPVQRLMAYGFNELLPNAIPGPSDAVFLRRLGRLDKDKYEEIMKLHGYNKTNADRLYATSERLLEAGDIIRLKWRLGMEDDEYHARMQKLGFDSTTADDLETASLYFPDPSDLVRFAIREVYTPATRERFGMDEDLPQEFLDEAAKAGLPEEQAKNYWAAHWELPSASMGFEMLHRLRPDVVEKRKETYKEMGLDPSKLPVEIDDLKLLLKSLDVMPFWRDRITAISYSPFTRVDVRRMYADGILSREEVKDAYMDLGYDDWHAEKLTEWTIAYTMPKERDLTRSMIERGYEEGELKREEASEYLQRMGYDEAEADFILTLKDNEIAEAEQKDKINTYKEQYLAGKLTRADFITKLDSMNLKPSYRDRIIAGADRQKEAKVRLPSRADLTEWLHRDIIKPYEYEERMKQLGYRVEDIANYMAAIHRLPKATDLKNWLKKDVIGIKSFYVYMEKLGYARTEIEKYVTEVRGVERGRGGPKEEEE